MQMIQLFMYMLKQDSRWHKFAAALSTISDWLEESCLTLNTSKTACMYFSINRKEVHQPDVTVQTVKLQIVSDFKYLGVVIDSHLTFNLLA